MAFLRDRTELGHPFGGDEIRTLEETENGQSVIRHVHRYDVPCMAGRVTKSVGTVAIRTRRIAAFHTCNVILLIIGDERFAVGRHDDGRAQHIRRTRRHGDDGIACAACGVSALQEFYGHKPVLSGRGCVAHDRKPVCTDGNRRSLSCLREAVPIDNGSGVPARTSGIAAFYHP